MTRDRYRQIRDLFQAVCELAPAAQRSYLERACGDDDELRREVESLLGHHEGAGQDVFEEERLGFGRQLVGEEQPQPMPRAPERVGAYRLLERIGEGGMGVVYRAEQARPRRIVAVKLMRRLASPSALRRFEAEAQLLGQLRHPGVAEVYEASVFDDGVERIPYYVMEFIPAAQPLTRYADSAALDTRARLLLFLSVCDAVHHGHQNGVIHRDLKPDNVLVDDAGRPKVIDFGVARVLTAERGTHATHTGQIVGTLAYISPEQLAADSRGVDIRADVYALGVMLFELLSGTAPLDVSDTSIPEACRIIREVEPTRLGALRADLRGDLELIAAKAIEKYKERRYGSAAELAADIRRHLADEPILARPPTLIYQLRKFARRNAGLVAGALATVASLVIGLAATSVLAVLATSARHAAERETYRASITATASALERHDVALARRSLEMAPAHLRAWEWDHLRSRLDESLRVIPTPDALPGAVPRFVVLPDADALLLPRAPGVGAWEAGDGRPLPLFAAPGTLVASDHAGTAQALLADGRLRVRSPGGAFSPDVSSLDPLLRGATRIAVSTGGRFVAVAAPDRVARLEVATGRGDQRAIDNRGTGVNALAVASDGTVLIAAALAGRPARWTPRGELRELAEVPGIARSVDVRPDGQRFVLGLQNTGVALCDADGALLAVGRGHEHAVTGVAWDPDGARVASVSLDRTVRLWRGDALAPGAVQHGHDRGLWGVAFSNDGKCVATTGEDRTIRLWDAEQELGRDALVGHAGFVFALAFSPDGRLLATAGWDRTVRLWELDSQRQVREFRVPAEVVTALAFSADGQCLAWIGDAHCGAFLLDDGRAVPAPTGAPAPTAVTVRTIGFLDDSRLLPLPWTLGPDGVTVWDVTAGACRRWPLAQLAGHRAALLAGMGRYAIGVAADDSPADVRTAQGDSGSALRVLDTRGGAVSGMPAFSGPFDMHSYSGGGALLAARRANDLTRVEVWDLAARQARGALLGHTDDVYAIAWSPDGRRLATAGRDSLRLWNAETFEEIVQLRGHTSFIWSLAFSPDGARLASGSGDRTVRIWGTRRAGAGR